MKTKIKALIGVAVLGLAAIFIGVGCQTAPSVNATVFHTSNALADGAISATHVFNLYAVTQPPSPELTNARTTLYQADIDLSHSLSEVEALRQTCLTNASATNQTAMLAVLAAAQQRSSNIVALVTYFRTNKPSRN